MPTLPPAVKDLLSLAERVAKGLETHGPWLGLAEMPAGEFRRILGEAGQAEAVWSAAEEARVYSRTRMATADKDIKAWLAKARLVVKLAHGEKWSERWIETGFAHRAANIPKGIQTRIGLARRLVNFLSLHPEYGVQFAEVTAARGRSVYERMIQTRDALELAMSDCATKKRLRNNAKRVLQHAIQQVIRMLNFTIAPNDPRWPEFGLSQSAMRLARKHCASNQQLVEVLTKPEAISLPPVTHSDAERTVAA